MQNNELPKFRSEEGFSLVMALWLMALLGIAGSMFAYQAIQQSRMTDAVIQRENAHSVARAGVELWMSRLNQDPTTHDAFTDRWGWGGQLKNGTNVGDTVYLPSGNNEFTEGDIGYFRVERIEDETGKHNLNEPLGTTGDTATKIMKKLPVSGLENALGKPDTSWVSSGDVVYVSGIGTAGYQNSLQVVSPYRIDGKININTATPQAMEGLIIRNFGDTEAVGNGCYYNSCDYFLGDATEDLITAIMEARSGGSLSAPSTEEEKENFMGGGGTPFKTTDEVCDTIEDAGGEGEQDFQCETFEKYIKVESEGIFRVLVRGVSMDAENDPVNAITLEAYVDRGRNPMRIISLREP